MTSTLHRAIPARAGRTVGIGTLTPNRTGPSPRVRGEPVLRWRSSRGITGHPRACGENYQAAWGGVARDPGHPRACGENDLLKSEPGEVQAGHPRACGENLRSFAVGQLQQLGPSPRVRGERARAMVLEYLEDGPSPRVRGEPPRARRQPATASGHPRACGENFSAWAFSCPCCSGHPRACGENQQARGVITECLSGHPRACGENGVNPLLLCGGGRAIPARAGRTLDKYRCFAR